MDSQTSKEISNTPNSANSVKRNLDFSFQESTPVYSTKSRKRKSITQDKTSSHHVTRKLSELINSTQDDNSRLYRIAHNIQKHKSSTHDVNSSQHQPRNLNEVINTTHSKKHYSKNSIRKRKEPKSSQKLKNSVDNSLENIRNHSMFTNETKSSRRNLYSIENNNLEPFDNPNIIRNYSSSAHDSQSSRSTTRKQLYLLKNNNIVPFEKANKPESSRKQFNCIENNNFVPFDQPNVLTIFANEEKSLNFINDRKMECNISECTIPNAIRNDSKVTNEDSDDFMMSSAQYNSDFCSSSDETLSYGSCVSDSDELRSCSQYESSSDELKSCMSKDYSVNFDFSFNFDNVMVSSPVNKIQEDVKLSSSLEKCSLFDFDVSAKRMKWDCETPNGRRKSNSAPGTPKHSGSDSENYIKKYHSLDFTVTKPGPNIKIGTPECKKILYPQLIERKPASKPKSPQKLRSELKRLNKPAKKRLFICHDFVYLFAHNSNNREIIHKIFSYLDDSDLANVNSVSHLWKSILREDKALYARYKRYYTHLIRSKENLRNNLPWGSAISKGFTGLAMSREKENIQTPTSITRSPAKSNWHKYIKVAANLTTEQKLTKCPMCSDPSVLEYNIAQCTKHHCQYIWCVLCLSGSKRGPEHFICKCEKGMTPPRLEKCSLGDISNFESPRNCSFLTNEGYFNDSGNFTNSNKNISSNNFASTNLNNHYYNISNSFNNANISNSFNNTANSSSGYFSQSDNDKSNLSNSKSALAVSNRCENGANEKKIVQEKCSTSFHRIAEICRRKKSSKKTNYEPSSPPKVKMAIVGSEKSKKSLRRLCM